MSRTKPSDYISGTLTPPPTTSLPTLHKRAHVRLPLPPSVRVYIKVRRAGATGPGARGMVTDISVGGLALSLTEGMRFDLPGEGQEVSLELDYEGGEARTRGRVVRSSALQMSVAFPPVTSDAEVNVELVSMIARVVTRQVEHFDRGRFAASLTARLAHERFVGGGHLDVRVQVAPPAWWQLVFLDYLVSWTEGGQVTTGILDRTSSSRAGGEVTLIRHPRAWGSLKQVAGLIAARCAAALPEHAAWFASIQDTLV